MDLQSFLDTMGARYRLLRHSPAYTAQDLAAAEHISGHEVIKTVVIRADGRFILCALPACYRVDLGELADQLQAVDVQLVEENRLAGLFPDCELGAEPPIGRLYGISTLMDESLVSDDCVTFQAGTHRDAISMTLAEYRRLAQPEMAHFARPMM